MPPRPKANAPEEETFFYVQIVDAELGKIRFGPFTARDDRDPHDDEHDAEEIAANLKSDIGSNGLQKALENRGIWGGLTVNLTGDDGTRLNVWEVEAP